MIVVFSHKARLATDLRAVNAEPVATRVAC